MSANVLFEWFNGSERHPRGERLKLWGGTHTKCDHATGECIAANAWSVTTDGKLTPRIVQHPLNERCNGRVTVVDTYGREIRNMLVWEAKGNVPFPESEGVRPALSVRRFLVDRARQDLATNLKYHKVTWTETRQALAEFDEKHAPLLTDDVPRLTKPSRGSK